MLRRNDQPAVVYGSNRGFRLAAAVARGGAIPPDGYCCARRPGTEHRWAARRSLSGAHAAHDRPRSCRNDRSKEQPATEQTEIHVAYDSERLYFAIYAHYSDPGLVRANRVDRDKLDNDDTVTFYLDPFLDQQRGYAFSVNGYGVQRDAMLVVWNAGRTAAAATESWNALFTSGGQLVDDGWTAEIAIPFKSLRYPGRGAGESAPLGISDRAARSSDQERARGTGRRFRATCSDFLRQMGTVDGMTESLDAAQFRAAADRSPPSRSAA